MWGSQRTTSNMSSGRWAVWPSCSVGFTPSPEDRERNSHTESIYTVLSFKFGFNLNLYYALLHIYIQFYTLISTLNLKSRPWWCALSLWVHFVVWWRVFFCIFQTSFEVEIFPVQFWNSRMGQKFKKKKKWKLSKHIAAPRLPEALKLHEMKNDFHFVGQFSVAEYMHLFNN